MKRFGFIIVATIAVVYLGACGAVYWFQRSSIYFPQPRTISWGARTMSLATDEGETLVSFRPSAEAGAVIYFGGNSEDVSGSLPGLAEAFPDRAIYAMHYRGYGGSTGKPTEAALFADAEALYEQVATVRPDIVVVGRSLGSGVAAYLASKRRVERLVLITPYDSLAEIGSRQLPFLPVNWLLIDKYESLKYAPQIAAPTRIIVAEHDDLIPRESSENLLRHFGPGIAELYIIKGTGHNNISFSPDYASLLGGERAISK